MSANLYKHVTQDKFLHNILRIDFSLMLKMLKAMVMQVSEG